MDPRRRVSERVGDAHEIPRDEQGDPLRTSLPSGRDIRPFASSGDRFAVSNKIGG